jgi:hypothetical protein
MLTDIRSRDFELRENKNSDSQNPLSVNPKFTLFTIRVIRTRKTDKKYRHKIPRMVFERTLSDLERPYISPIRNNKKDNPNPELSVNPLNSLVFLKTSIR